MEGGMEGERRGNDRKVTRIKQYKKAHIKIDCGRI
jgi:hypothetical protein